MKANTKFILAAFGIGVGILFLTGCHHFAGGGCGYAPAPAPVASAPVPTNPSTPSTPAQPNAPDGHQH